jgi:hypothetical protein
VRKQPNALRRHFHGLRTTASVGGPEKQKAPIRGFLFQGVVNSGNLNVRRLHALRALLGFESHFLIFLQRLETFGANFREMGKKVFATRVGRDKAKAFGIVEPLDSTGFHISSST